MWSDEKKTTHAAFLFFFCFLKIQGREIRNPTKKSRGLMYIRKGGRFL